MNHFFESYVKDVNTALSAVSWEAVRKMTDVLQRARHQNSMVYLMGNGGSAATASHFANDLIRMGKVRAVALTDLTPTMMAYGNDTGWENMFAGVLRTMLLPQDVVVGISCSGLSANVVEGIKMAKEINYPAIRTVVLTGSALDSPLARLNPDVIVSVPFGDVRVQEDCHLAICHAVAGALR